MTAFEMMADPAKFAENLKTATLSQLAEIITRDHSNQARQIYFGAKPYVAAMGSMSQISDQYGADDGRSIVNYALCNLGQWRGEVARAVKSELKRRLKTS